MRLKTRIYYGILLVGVLVLFWGGMSYVNGLNPQKVQANVQKMIRKAEKLAKHGKNDKALRLLFDALYKEAPFYVDLDLKKRYEEGASMTASDALMNLKQSLIHEDQSPLMHWFRDPDIPVREKLDNIARLRDFVSTLHETTPSEEHIRFLGKYNGTFIRLLSSHTLSEGEKFDVLFTLQEVIQTEYVSTAQQNRIQEEIAQLLQEADRKFQEHRYVETFILLTEATQKAHDIQLRHISQEDDTKLYKQRDHFANLFVQIDESPLMQRFKDQQISPEKKKHILSELRRQHTAGAKTFLFEGNEYDGPLMQILSNPKISLTLKLLLLDYIQADFINT